MIKNLWTRTSFRSKSLFIIVLLILLETIRLTGIQKEHSNMFLTLYRPIYRVSTGERQLKFSTLVVDEPGCISNLIKYWIEFDWSEIILWWFNSFVHPNKRSIFLLSAWQRKKRSFVGRNYMVSLLNISKVWSNSVMFVKFIVIKWIFFFICGYFFHWRKYFWGSRHAFVYSKEITGPKTWNITNSEKNVCCGIVVNK